jgi:hypothetical protein
MQVLEGEHAIKADRGRITVRDRGLLQEHADGCYGLPEVEYERLLDRTLPSFERKPLR